MIPSFSPFPLSSIRSIFSNSRRSMACDLPAVIHPAAYLPTHETLPLRLRLALSPRRVSAAITLYPGLSRPSLAFFSPIRPPGSRSTDFAQFSIPPANAAPATEPLRFLRSGMLVRADRDGLDQGDSLPFLFGSRCQLEQRDMARAMRCWLAAGRFRRASCCFMAPPPRPRGG